MKRTIVKQVALTPDEAGLLETNAKQKGMTISEMIRSILNSNQDDFSETKKVIESCLTIPQLTTAEKMVLNYREKYPNDYQGLIRLNDLIYRKFKTLCHEKRASEQNAK